MAFDVEAKHVAAAYEFLCALPPFSEWGMPPASEVKFLISNVAHTYGEYFENPHVIRVSRKIVGQPGTLIAVVAHEMVHLYQVVEKSTNRSQHNKRFHALAAEVCAAHGFDPKAF